MHKRLVNFLVGVFIFLLLTFSVYAGTSDTSDGSFTLNATPAVSDVDFVDNTYTTTSTLTPDGVTLFGVNFTITHSAGMTDVLNITIFIFDDSAHGGDFNTTTPDGDELVSIVWIESDAANGTSGWGPMNQGTFSEWTYNDGNSIDPGVASAETTYEFSLQFDISWAALASADWNCSVFVYDDDATPEYDFASEPTLVTMDAYFDISFSTATFSWGNDIEPDSVNNTHGAINLNIKSNAAWTLTISATDFIGGGGADIDATDVIIWDEDGVGGGLSLAVKTGAGVDAKGNWLSQSAMTDETDMTRNMYILLTDTGSGLFSVGQLYTTTITVAIGAA